MDVPDEITCVDCGESAHRLGEPPGEGWSAGDYVAYRCSGCNDRWDLLVAGPDEAAEAAARSAEARAILGARRSDS